MHAFFQQGKRGKIFSLFYPSDPAIDSNQAVLFFPPFAEEMNKCRHMLAMQSRALQRLGIASLLIDLFGTGDSEGEFDHATFEDWCSDFETAVLFLEKQGIKKIVLLGVRFGALMAMHVCEKLSLDIQGYVFWQPVLKGEIMVTQFLRMKVVADMMGGAKKITTQELRQQINNRSFVEVAGYSLTPSLIQPIDSLSLDRLTKMNAKDIAWFDLVSDSTRTIGSINQKLIGELRKQGFKVYSNAIVGETFWSTPELATVPELISQSTVQIASMFS